MGTDSSQGQYHVASYTSVMLTWEANLVAVVLLTFTYRAFQRFRAMTFRFLITRFYKHY